MSSLFHNQVLQIEKNILIFILCFFFLVVFALRGFRKNYINFYDITFPIGTVITTQTYWCLVIVTMEYNLFIKIHNFNGCLKIWWRHQKVK